MIESSPDFPDAHGNLGAALLSTGRVDEAISELEKALALSPNYAEAHSNLGTALAQRGRLDQAIPHLRKAIEYSPQDANSQRNLALALLMAGTPTEGVLVGEQAVKLSNGKDPTMLSLLSRLYAETGRMTEALRTARQALALAAQRNDRDLVQELNEMVAAYQAPGPGTKP